MAETERTGLALSIQQPWAWLIVNGYKPVENRDWSTRLRGRVGIHAGKKLDLDGYNWVRRQFPSIKLPPRGEFPLGGIVGFATLVDCVTSLDSPWFVGKYGFVLADPTIIAPLRPCRGMLGFFRPAFKAVAS